MYNELFQRLKQSSPQLAKIIEQDPSAMRRLDKMEEERIAVEIGQLLQDYIPGLTTEFRLDDNS